MAKKITKPAAPIVVRVRQIFNFPLRTKYIIIAAAGLVFYFNTLWNKYAYDDSISIILNSYVQMGFEGIPKILTNDSYASFYSNGGANASQQLGGGRYRPLSEIFFAIEQGIFGKSDFIIVFRHFVNIAAYILCLLAIFYFLDKYLLRKIPWGSDCAFLSTVLFAIHPLHTEVVANIKSLDELLCLLFTMLTFIFSLKYISKKENKFLIYGLFSYFLALLAKEYAITLILFIPLLFYLIGGKKPSDAVISTIPYMVVFGVYIVLRLNAVGFHSALSDADNPYLHVARMQKFATEWFFMGRYLKLLFLPYPLFYDYSYYHTIFRNMTDVLVLLSILIYVSVFAWGIYLAVKKNILAFPVFFFLLNLLMVSNFFLDIGAVMGERLAFLSSLGFVIIVSYFFLKVLTKQSYNSKKGIVFTVVSVLSVVCFGETVVRNAQWKDNNTLFLNAVAIAPGSYMANTNAGWVYLGESESTENTPEQARADLDSAYKFTHRAIQLNGSFKIAYDNMGAIDFHLGKYDSTEYNWDEALKLSDGTLHPRYDLLVPYIYRKGLDLGQKGDFYGAIRELRKAVNYADTNANIWYALGGAYYTVKNYDSARYAWLKTLQLHPGDVNAQQGLQSIQQFINQQSEKDK